MADSRGIIEVLPHPPAPTSLEESGLELDLVVQLTLKTLHFAGELTGTQTAERLGLTFPVVEPALDLLRAQHQVEIVGGLLVGSHAYRYRITDAGRVRAGLFLEQSHYVGVAPVPLDAYQEYMGRHAQALPHSATRDEVKNAFRHLVLTDRVLDQLGPAINAGHSLFVYGPPGNGKTVISQAIHNLLVGDIAIPHSLEVEGNVIRLFDPVVHERVPADEHSSEGLEASQRPDRRWVRCRRPLVMVGGELTIEALDLGYNPATGFYRAPVQALANGGILVIDDFGRQRCTPQELLNRWITPLESRIDYLTLQTGQKIAIPFHVLVAFATNLRPADLVDEAFLRRIHYKVFAESPSIEDFLKIFETCCHERRLSFDADLVEQLLKSYYHPRQIPLRGCHPRDLIEQALMMGAYKGTPGQLTLDLLLAACESYFVDDRETLTEYAPASQ